MVGEVLLLQPLFNQVKTEMRLKIIFTRVSGARVSTANSERSHNTIKQTEKN